MRNGEVEQQSPFYFAIRQMTENTLPLLHNSVVQPLLKCYVSVVQVIEKKENSVKGNEND